MAEEFDPAMLSGKASMTITRPDGTEIVLQLGRPVSVTLDDGELIFDYGYIAEIEDEFSIRLTKGDILEMALLMYGRKPEGM